jgi:hypothetical protein
MMNVRLLKTSALALASIVSMSAISVGPASASPSSVTFKFDNMGGTTYNSSGQNASSTQIQNYMTNVLHTAGLSSSSVKVTGALGEQGASSYTGDNHVVGPVIDTQPGAGVTNQVFPLTLANTEGLTVPSATGSWDANPPALSNSNPDGYIKNCTPIDPGSSNGGKNGCGSSSADIFMNFTALKIVSFSFDFEIFPDGSCTQLNTAVGQNTCGKAVAGNLNPSLPDLEIWAGDNGTGDSVTGKPIATFWGIAPNTGTTCDSTPSNSGDNLTYNQSGNGKTDSSGNPVYTSPATETAPQLLCHTTITNAMILAATGSSYLTTLDFMDWPETIGIDNLKIYLPEPTSIALFGFGILGLAMFARRKHLIASTKQV